MSNSFFRGTEGRNPAVVGKLKFFAFEHLRDQELRDFSRNFAELAQLLLDRLPDDPELTIALDKLREAKDRAVGLAAVTFQGQSDRG
jgi:hypothetical protein